MKEIESGIERRIEACAIEMNENERAENIVSRRNENNEKPEKKKYRASAYLTLSAGNDRRKLSKKTTENWLTENRRRLKMKSANGESLGVRRRRKSLGNQLKKRKIQRKPPAKRRAKIKKMKCRNNEISIISSIWHQ